MIDLDEYEETATFGELTKFERTVTTPGYRDEEAECREVVYEGFGKQWLVRRVSTLGWNVTQYDGNSIERRAGSGGDYFDEEESAHETARGWVEEVAG